MKKLKRIFLTMYNFYKYYFNFERNYDVLQSKSSCILLDKNINFNKNETESKMGNPTHSFRETNLVLQLIENCKLKVKLWWVGTRERNSVSLCPKKILCMVYWMHFQNIHTFTYQKALIYSHSCLLLKSSKAFSVSLIFGSFWKLLKIFWPGLTVFIN